MVGDGVLCRLLHARRLQWCESQCSTGGSAWAALAPRGLCDVDELGGRCALTAP